MAERPQPGTLIAGRYELEQPIGAGGVGQVFSATDQRLGRRVAIKLIVTAHARSADPATTERFVTEARSGATFIHPHAVTVFDAGVTSEYLFLVTELVEGTNLATRIAHGGPMPVGEAVRVADHLLQALGAAHRAGIVHRDVKPANVLLDRESAAKLADFGIAKRLDDLEASLTSTGHFIGTAGYAAPEQAAGQRATPATDLYATGVTLYEMLTGAPPYTGDSPIAVALAHREAPIPDVRTSRAEVSAALEAVLHRALAKDPAERFADADEMRAALRAAVQATAQAPVVSVAGAAAAGGGEAGRGDSAGADPRGAAPVGTVPGEITPLMASHRDGSVGATSRRWWWAVAAVAVVALSMWGLVALTSGAGDRGTDDSPDHPFVDNDDGGRGGGGAQPQPVAEATTTAASPTTVGAPPDTAAPPTAAPPPTEPTTAPPVAPAFPTDMGSLIAYVEHDPGSLGPRGVQLLDELRAVEWSRGEVREDAADDLMDDIDDWIDDGEIDPGFGELAIDILDVVKDTAGD